MLNLGTLQFGLAIDTRALRAAQERVNAFGQAVSRAQQAANRGLDTNISAFRKQENAMLRGLEQLKNLTNQISKSNISPELKTDMIARAGRAYNDLTKNIGSATKMADATKFDRSVAAFRSGVGDMKRELSGLSSAQSTAATAAKNTEAAIDRQANALARAEQRVRNFNAGVERSKIARNDVAPLTNVGDQALANLKQALSGGAVSTRAYSAAMNDFNAKLGEARRHFADATAKVNNFTKAEENMRNVLRGVGSSFLLLNGHLGGVSTRLFALSQIASTSGTAVAGAAAAVTGFVGAASLMVKGSIQTTLQLEKASKALETIAGNSAEAALGMDYVRKISNQAGVEFAGTAQSYGRYTAAAKAANQTAQETNRQFQIVALAAGKLNLGVEDTQGVFRALEQILSKGKVQSEELRGQLGDRLPGAFAIAAKSMNTTTAALSDMMKKGDVLSSDFVPKFVSALQAAYNIDVSKNVDTLQASLTRLTNAQTFAFDAFSKSTGVVKSYKAIVDSLAAGLGWLESNMDAVVQGVLGFTGAVVGAAAALAAMAAVNLVVAGITAMGSAIAAATTVMGGLNAAVTVFNAVTSASFLGLLLRITAAAAGAYYGFNMLQDMLRKNNSALGDTSGADAFIAQQTKMRTATDETTQALIRQQQVQLRAAQAAQQEAMAKVRASKQTYDRNMSNTTIFGGKAKLSENERKFQEDIYGKPLKEDTRNLQEATSAVVRQTNAVNGLKKVLATPMAKIPDIMGDTSDKKKKTKEAQDNINRILAVIDEYQAAQEKLAALSKASGPDGLDLIDDLLKAKDQLRGLSDKELNMATAALEKLGLSTGNLVKDLASMNTAIRKSQEQSRVFEQAWKNIDRQMIELEGIDRITSFLTQGGDPRKVFLVEALTDAHDALRKLDDSQLEAIRQKLLSLGYSGKTAAEALATLFASQDKGKILNDTLASVALATEDAQRRIAKALITQKGLGEGRRTSAIVEQMLANKDAVDEYVKALMQAGKTAEEAQEAVRGLYAAMNQADAIDRATARMKQAQEEWRQVFDSLGDAAWSNFRSIIEGVKSVSDALQEIALDFVWDAAKTALDQLFRGGQNSDDEAAARAANTTAIDLNTQSLDQLIEAINSLNLGASSTGGGDSKGGGFLGTLGKTLLGKGAGLLKGLIAPRAGGGHVTKGQGYRIAEPGTGGEIYFPGQSGSMMPLRQMMQNGGGSSSTVIDASTKIDARGATRDAINMLREEMRQRDQRLQQMLPTMVDTRVMENKWRGRAGAGGY